MPARVSEGMSIFIFSSVFDVRHLGGSHNDFALACLPLIFVAYPAYLCY